MFQSSNKKNSNGDMSLIRAVREHRLDLVTTILTRPECTSKTINEKDSYGHTALDYAGDSNSEVDADIIKAIAASSHCNSETLRQKFGAYGYTLLTWAAKAGDLDTVRSVLANPDCTEETLNHAVSTGETALVLALAHAEIAQVILASPHCKIKTLNRKIMPFGETLLIAAARVGLLDIIKSILANPYCDLSVLSQQNKQFEIASSVAISNENIEISELIKCAHQKYTSGVNELEAYGEILQQNIIKFLDLYVNPPFLQPSYAGYKVEAKFIIQSLEELIEPTIEDCKNCVASIEERLAKDYSADGRRSVFTKIYDMCDKYQNQSIEASQFKLSAVRTARC